MTFQEALAPQYIYHSSTNTGVKSSLAEALILHPKQV